MIVKGRIATTLQRGGQAIVQLAQRLLGNRGRGLFGPVDPPGQHHVDPGPRNRFGLNPQPAAQDRTMRQIGAQGCRRHGGVCSSQVLIVRPMRSRLSGLTLSAVSLRRVPGRIIEVDQIDCRNAALREGKMVVDHSPFILRDEDLCKS